MTTIISVHKHIAGRLIRFTFGSAILLFAAASAQAQESACQPVDSTGLPYSIIIDEILVCGGAPSQGDIVCVLDGDLAVGEFVIGDTNTFPIAVTAWQADPSHGLDGFEPGNQITVSYFSSSRQELLTLQAFFSVGDGRFGTTSYTRADSLVEFGYSPPLLACPFDPVNTTTCGNEVICLPVSASNFDSITVENGAYVSGEVCFPIGDESKFYSAWVVAYNACGVDSCVVTIDPIHPSRPSACFSNPSIGEPPFDVLFTNCSSPFQGVSYLWSFGDGSSSTEMSPRHVYEVQGCYDVTLVVSNRCYADTLTMPNAVCVGKGDKCIQIDLVPDWNLISWNVTVADSIQTVFSEVMPCVDVILGYDRGGLTYDPLKPQFSDLLEVDYRHGYWVRMNCPDTLVLCDSSVATSTGIELDEGWNLISYLPSVEQQTTDALTSISGSFDLAFAFYHGVLAYNPALPGFTTMTTMRPGLGYWVRSLGAGVLWYPGFSTIGGVTVPGRESAEGFAGPNWFCVYTEKAILNDRPIVSGTRIEFRSTGGDLLGATTAVDGPLPFTPVYARTASNPWLTGISGESIGIWVEGERVLPDLIRPERYERIELPALKSKDDEIAIPQDYVLGQNYPNPFNPSTRIDFSLPQESDVRIDVYNLVGQRVSTILDRHLSSGNHFVVWTAKDSEGLELPSGLYVYRIRAADWTASRKMTLLR